MAAGVPAKVETRVGLFILVGLVFLGGLIVQFGRFGDRLRGSYQLTVVFNDAAGVIKGSEVRMGGARIGRVAEVPALTDEVKVEVTLDVDERIRIPSGSRFQVSSATLLGDKLIVITPPTEPEGGMIEPGSRLDGAGAAGFDAIQDNAIAFSQDARHLMMRAEETLGGVDAAVEEIRVVARRLSTSLEKVNDSVLDEENLGRIDGMIANLEATSREWAEASDQLEPAIVEVREAVESIGRAAEGAEETFAKANARIDELGPAFEEVPRAVASISRAADQAAETFERVEQGDGLLGTLAYDDEVSDDAKTFIRNLKQYGILRYRDKETPPDDPRNRFRGRRR